MSGVTRARWLMPCQRGASGRSSVTFRRSAAMASIARLRPPDPFGPVSVADVSFDDILLVMVVAVAVPLLLGLFPRLPVPSSVLEIAAGILIGPAVLDWGI